MLYVSVHLLESCISHLASIILRSTKTGELQVTRQVEWRQVLCYQVGREKEKGAARRGCSAWPQRQRCFLSIWSREPVWGWISWTPTTGRDFSQVHNRTGISNGSLLTSDVNPVGLNAPHCVCYAMNNWRKQFVLLINYPSFLQNRRTFKNACWKLKHDSYFWTTPIRNLFVIL